MKTKITGLNILGISGSVPREILHLETLAEKFGESEVKRIIASTGINSVRVASANTSCADLCFVAAKNLLTKLDISAKSIDAIVFISQTSEFIAPATSAILQNRLDLSKEVVAFDINYGCSGYIYGLYQAALLINSGCRRVLLCAGDVITPLLNDEDRQLRMVLGDAGSATIIEKGMHEFDFNIKTDGSGAQHIIAKRMSPKVLIPEYFYMNGAKIMEFALREVPSMIEEILEAKKWVRDDVDTFALHQPNRFMLDYIRKKSKLPKDAVISSVEMYGNTGPASIPLVLSEHYSRKSSLEKVVMCGFGVGLSWGAIGLSLQDTALLPVIELH